MIRHVVLIKSAFLSKVDEIIDEMPSLVGTIPGLTAVECGKNFSPRSQGYDRMFIMDFESRDQLAQWGPHPAHQPIRESLMQLATMIVIDYEA